MRNFWTKYTSGRILRLPPGKIKHSYLEKLLEKLLEQLKNASEKKFAGTPGKISNQHPTETPGGIPEESYYKKSQRIKNELLQELPTSLKNLKKNSRKKDYKSSLGKFAHSFKNY